MIIIKQQNKTTMNQEENKCYLCEETESEVTALIVEGDRYVCDNCIINR